MEINGKKIPEWMAKYNTKEHLQKIADGNYKVDPNHKTNMTMATAKDLAEDEFGVIAVMPQGPAVVAMGISEQEAVDYAYGIHLQNPNIPLMIIETTMLEDYIGEEE